MNITTAEIIEALHDARSRLPSRPEGAHTVTEIARATGWSRNAVIKRLYILRDAGVLEATHVSLSSIDGRVLTVPAYRTIVRSRKTKR
jgi:DNA-binding Lrp family transcriptional regulator